MSKINFIFLISVIIVSLSCNLDSTEPDVFTECTGAFPLDHIKDWNLVSAKFSVSGTDYLITPDNCQDTICPEATLTFTDSTYTFDFFLPYLKNNNTLDTLINTEAGSYQINYCFSSSSNGEIPSEWTGVIQFKPTLNSADDYSPNFSKLLGEPMELQTFNFENGTIEFKLTDLE